jgi:beta-glucosidase
LYQDKGGIMAETAQEGPDRLEFPAGFLWGVATSSHQYEGGNTNNQWHEWERTGHIRTGEQSGLACDWWANTECDFDRAADLGLNALRLSLEWSRIEPRPGAWDAAALARYREMLLGLRARDIEPLVTLHHFTDPLWLTARGAWLAPDAPSLFARYTGKVVEALGDLCDFWCTINEPNVYAVTGYQLGDYPPGRRGAIVAAFRVLGSLARGHAAAYRAIHALQPGARVGWAQHYYTFDPMRPHSALDRWVAGIQAGIFNELFPDAVRAGRMRFPAAPFAGDLRGVRDTCDFVGINAYYRDFVRFDLTNPLEVFGRRSSPADAPRGDPGLDAPGGAIYPQGVLRAAQRVAAFGKPVYVTESGVADATDRLRPWVIARAVGAAHAARAAGVDLRGYFHWSLVDNFEWTQGWAQRFGLVALDEHTQARTPRPSAAFYGAIARANALTRDLVAEHAPMALDELFP